jgi:hypothetical protein
MSERETLRPKKARNLETIEDLETGLQIDEYALDEALVAQPEYFYRVSKKLALTVSQRDAAKQGLAEEEARCDGQFREDAAREKEKLTETEVKNLIRLDKEVIKQQEQLNRLNREVGLLTALKEAYQQRSYVLKDLTSLHIANYYTNTDGAPSGRAALRDHTAQVAKAGMNRMRRQRDDRD